MSHGPDWTYWRARHCRCDDCRRLVTRHQKLYRIRTRADRQGNPTIPLRVDRQPILDHVARLRASGWTVKQLAEEVGVTMANLSWMVSPSNPTKRMDRQRAARILAVAPLEPVTVDDVVVDRFIDGGMSWRELTREERIEAARRMDAAGVSRAQIAEATHLRSETLYAEVYGRVAS